MKYAKRFLTLFLIAAVILGFAGYRYYTGRIWGTAANFDITLNTDLGISYIEKCIDNAL